MKLKSETYRGMLINFTKKMPGIIIATVKRKYSSNDYKKIGYTKQEALEGMKRLIDRRRPKR
jgi:hypothetical protein